MIKFRVDIHFVKSAKSSVFGWIGKANDKNEATDMAIADARACGFNGQIKATYTKVRNE